MQPFNSPEEMIEAYVDHLNNVVYKDDPIKGDWSAEAVNNIFVKVITPIEMKLNYGIEIAQWTRGIPNFGYWAR